MAEQYILDIKEKDEMSILLSGLAGETHSYPFFEHKIPFFHLNEVVPGKNGICAVNIPEGKLCVVYSVSGNSEERNVSSYARSVVDNIFSAGRNISAQVLGMADIIDASRTDEGLVRAVGEALRDRAIYRGIPILNGELANLGVRVKGDCNITGTGIAQINRDSYFVRNVPGVFEHDGIHYAVFDPKGKPVIINSDGVGTKTEFYERTGKYNGAVNDFFAMNLDDCVKMGATPQVISGFLEHYGDVYPNKIRQYAFSTAKKMNILSIMQDEFMPERIDSYCPSAFNISGSVVSTVDFERLANPLVPEWDDSLIAIHGKPNPRSNGITVRRKIMRELFGAHFENTPEGKVFLEYLSEPSTIFYPVFKRLIDNNLVSSVFHMSGGAYDSKLAKPIAKAGLYAEIGRTMQTELYSPDWREVLMTNYTGGSLRDCYAKWPMGNEGFVTSKYPELVIPVINQEGLEARVVARLESVHGKTGIKLKAFNGEEIYFPGK